MENEGSMCDYKSTKRGKIAASIIGMMMLVVVLFSVFYIAREADHRCLGENCPVCAVLARCESSLQRIGTVAAIAQGIQLLVLFAFKKPLLQYSVFAFRTPVLEKVRMNN